MGGGRGRRKGDEKDGGGARGAERSEWSRSEWPLSSRAAGCVSDGRFIWRNPVYETLDARTHDAYACMYARLLFRRYTARMDRKRPGL